MVTNKTTAAVKVRQTEDPHLVIFKTNAGVFMRRIRESRENLSAIFSSPAESGMKSASLAMTRCSLVDQLVNWYDQKRRQEVLVLNGSSFIRTHASAASLGISDSENSSALMHERNRLAHADEKRFYL